MFRFAIVAVIVLAGCNTTPPLPTVPKVIRVPVEVMVAVPAELSRDCDLVAKKANTIGEAVRLANARLESLKACNKDKASIRALKP